MSIVQRLIHFIQEKRLLAKSDRILLAVSGGKDSMLMAKLFHDMGRECIIAHCNFQLRAEHSDKDEELVREYALQLGFPVFVKQFDTEHYASENKISIQMAARELRYAWFEELRQEQECSVIAIAQHANDHIETVLLNLTRSTGLQGLLGIHAKRDNIIRPILFMKAEEVEHEVGRLEVPYRDDQSNFSTKYARNKIRLEIIPKFKEIQPDFESILEQNIKHFEESFQFIQHEVSLKRAKLFHEEGQYIKVNKDELRKYIHSPYFLFELFRPFGFARNIIEDLISVFDHGMGQLFESPTHELLLDRVELIVRKKAGGKIKEQVLNSIDSDINEILGKRFSINDNEPFQISEDKFRAQVDMDKLSFPLTIRSWKTGDSFKPLGMSGSKKLSDYFIQEKLNRFEKDRVPVLVNADGSLIWVIGMRLDNRFKVTENTKKVLTLVYK